MDDPRRRKHKRKYSRIAVHRGFKIAIVAVARRLARIAGKPRGLKIDIPGGRETKLSSYGSGYMMRCEEMDFLVDL